jgi:predicted phage terminase large subunit-like protein
MPDKYVELFEKTQNIEKKFDVLCSMLEELQSKEDNIPFRDKYIELCRDLRKLGADTSRDLKETYEKRARALEVYRKTFLLTSHYVFEDFMIYLEMNRPYNEQFYRPRMHVLKPLVDALQEIHEGKLQELFISMPPRVGKSTVVTFFLVWKMGLDSERTNLYSSCSDTNTNSYYRGVSEIIQDEMTYNFKEIFPNTKIVQQNSKMNTLDLNRKKKYPSLTCRSIGGTLNGSCDCNGLLIADDLVTGIEEVFNPERMMKLWRLVDNNLITRAKESCAIIWIGTRWSLIDPAGLRIDVLENDPAYKNRRYRILNIPALNEDDESNFQYKYGVGYSTDYYRQRRASFERNNDLGSWLAQYMGEPIEREGTLFDSSDLKFYNGVLPAEEPVRISAVVDVAWGGGDFTSCPVAYVYEDSSVYIHDVVFNNGDKKITQPLIARKLMMNGVKDVDFEKNNGGKEFAEGVERELDNIGYKLVITSHNAPTTKAKNIRIFQQAPEIRNFYFLEAGKRSKEYTLFMNNLFSFKVVGKNKHDDAPDSLAQLSERLNGVQQTKIKVFQRPF